MNSEYVWNIELDADIDYKGIYGMVIAINELMWME